MAVAEPLKSAFEGLKPGRVKKFPGTKEPIVREEEIFFSFVVLVFAFLTNHHLNN